MRGLDTSCPRERTNDVTQTGNSKDKKEAGTQSLNARNYFTNSGPANEISKQGQAQKTEDDAKWRKSPAATLLLSQNIIRHRRTVPHGLHLSATSIPFGKMPRACPVEPHVCGYKKPSNKSFQMPWACPMEFHAGCYSFQREAPRRKAVASRPVVSCWLCSGQREAPRDKPVASASLFSSAFCACLWLGL